MTTAPHSLIEVRHLRKRYGRVVALDDVSFEVRAGEVLGLIGPNGAGKTTLFECMAGVLPYDRGSVRAVPSNFELQTSNLSNVPPMFYVPDSITPWPAQPLQWALEFSAGFLAQAGDDRLEDVVAALDLQPLLGTRIAALSKGQRKRALLAIGLLTSSPVLLIDEPFDGLDLRQTRAVAALLRQYATGGRTLFLSIHQISDAARVCDRFVLIGGGRIRGTGTLAELSATSGAPADLEEVFLALT
ncbi:MAG TPA: ABC transporter ATP-binding protein [Vicinamibacterales bacterium]|nr:ABC transporter ATP-binding protein [Vicinamibacterales bacterium]